MIQADPRIQDKVNSLADFLGKAGFSRYDTDEAHEVYFLTSPEGRRLFLDIRARSVLPSPERDLNIGHIIPYTDIRSDEFNETRSQESFAEDFFTHAALTTLLSYAGFAHSVDTSMGGSINGGIGSTRWGKQLPLCNWRIQGHKGYLDLKVDTVEEAARHVSFLQKSFLESTLAGHQMELIIKSSTVPRLQYPAKPEILNQDHYPNSPSCQQVLAKDK